MNRTMWGTQRSFIARVLAAMATVVLLAVFPHQAQADVGDFINVQGRLLSQAGTAVPDGEYAMTLAFYKTQNATSAVYTYIAVGVKVKAGIFQIRVGEKLPLNKKVFRTGEAGWLGITIGSDNELARLPLYKVPYAIRSDFAESASKLACTGCITKSHLDASLTASLVSKSDLAKVATSGSYDDLQGRPDLVALNQACEATQVVAGIGADGKVVCKADKNDSYDGSDFATSGQKCDAGFVAAGIDAKGNLSCVKDKDVDTTYSGKDFATSDQKCATGMVFVGIDAIGKAVCAKDKDTNTTYDGKNFALSGKACPANRVMAGITALGAPICVLDQKGQSSGKDFALSNQGCGVGKVVSGIDVAGKVVCSLKGQVSGTPYAVSNQKCTAGMMVTGVGANGKVTCSADKNTTYTGKNFALSNKKCSTNQVMTGISASGVPTCVSDTNLQVDWIYGWAKRSATAGKWLSSLGWGKPDFSKDAAYSDLSGVSTSNSATVDFPIPSAARTVYLATLNNSTGGYFDVWLRYGTTWKFHRRVHTWQPKTSQNTGGAQDGAMVVQLATGLQGYSAIRIKGGKGRVYFGGLAFSRADAQGEAGSGLVHWDSIADKPALAATSFSSTEVKNLQASKLANGTTPWTAITGKKFALSNQSCAAGQVLRGIDSNGQKVCVADANTKYSGSDFALSNKACASGYVMRGTSASGSPVCVLDKDTNTKYSGANFALSNKTCPTGSVMRGVSSNGAPNCIVDANTKYSGANFALSNKVCASGYVMRGVTSGGQPACVKDADSKYSGSNFALSNKGCPTGFYMRGVSSSGTPLCSKDLKGTSSGADFALSNQICPTGQVVRAISTSGKVVCATDKDTNTKYSGANFALSNKTCPTGFVMRGVTSAGEPNCIKDKDTNTTYSGANFALSNKTCPTGFVMRGVTSGGQPNCIKDKDTNTTYSGANFALSNQVCASGYVMRGVTSGGQPACIKDTNSTYSGANFALSNKTCSSGFVMRGVLSNGQPNCIKDKDTNSTYSGANFALSNKTCSTGYVMRGVLSNGQPNCIKDKDTNTTYSGSNFALSNKACSSGYVMRGVSSSGNPTCVKVAAQGVSVTRGYSQKKSSSSGWLASGGWGEPRFSTSAAYTASSTLGTEYMDFDIPSGTRTAYVSFLQWNNGGYFDIYLRSGSTWKFHKRISNYQAVSNSSAGGTYDANTVVLAATGLEHFSQIRLQNRKGRLHFSGLGFSFDDMTGAGNAGFSHWDTVVGKPKIQYTSAIAADDFTQTEVNNLRNGKLDNGTTPWVMGADDFTQTEVNNLRAGKLDNGTTPWVMGADDFTQTEVNNLRNGKLDNGTTPWVMGADDFTQTEVNNLRAGKLDNGTTPWVMPADDFTQAEVNNLRAGKLDDGSQPWNTTIYDTNNTWLRERGDNAHFKIYGNSRSLVMRTDGTTQYQSNGGYPFLWLYGGDNTGNRLMMMNTSGQLWTKDYGWLHEKFQAKGSYVNKTGDTMTGHLKISKGGDNAAGGLLLYRADSSTSTNERLGGIGFDSSDGNLPSDLDEASASIIAYAAESHGTGDKGGYLAFRTSDMNQDDDTIATERMRISANGNIGIGTSSNSYKLYVNGTTYFKGSSTTTGNAYFHEDVRLGNTYDDRIYAYHWRVYDKSNEATKVHLDRYQVVLTYTNYYKNTKALDMNRIREYCDDYDGCQVVIGMVDWLGSGFHHHEMAHYTFRFHYDAGTGRWRVADGGPGSANSGVDGNHTEKHILNAYDSCYFTEMAYSGGVKQNDGSKQLYFLYWDAYVNQYYKNKKCVITFMD